MVFLHFRGTGRWRNPLLAQSLCLEFFHPVTNVVLEDVAPMNASNASNASNATVRVVNVTGNETVEGDVDVTIDVCRG